ncbi:MAG: homoserine kinase, partial [Tissierellia bacterium]|nr:homoserine kinase [Tissierellia bacterium]
MVKYKVPATSANLGPGFDVLGLAVDLYNTVELEEIERGLEIFVSGINSDVIPKDKSNLAYTIISDFFDRVGYEAKGLRINISNCIPVARGLGSSASIVVGSLLCANDIS